MFIDSHCHLSFPELQERLPDILQSMADADVGQALCICTTLEEFDAVHALTRHPQLWATVGVHPDNEGVREPTLDDLLAGAARSRVVGIGETGLDYYRLEGRSVADMEWQRERFRTHIRAARQTDLPLVIHTRAASDDTLAILREAGELSAVILVVVSLAGIFAFSLSTLGVIDPITRTIVQSGLSEQGVLGALIVMLLIAGMFLDGISIFLIFVPLLMPIMQHYQWDVVWFGVVLTLTVAIGQFTPPVAINLMVTAEVAKIRLEQTVGGAALVGVVMSSALLLVAIFPEIALWLPDLAYGR